MNPRETGSSASGVTPFRRLDDQPVFDEPWQAEILAIADTLVARGMIKPAQWSETLGAELAQAATRGEPDDMATYYGSALKALETLLSDVDGLSTADVNDRRDAWADAYRATPHGQPVILPGGVNSR